MIYDIIGDVHGYADALCALLTYLGYKKKQSGYTHPDNHRKVIYVGDIVDRGPDIPESLRIVRSMVDAGSAEIVLGNHEYNLLAYTTRDKSNPDRFLRSHSDVHERQSRQTFKQFESDNRILDDYLSWFMQIPLFLDLPELRVVHAAWHPEAISEIRKKSPEKNCLTVEMLQESARPGSPAYNAIEYSLKGLEIQLPNGMSYEDKEGCRRSRSRTAWWYSKDTQDQHSLYDLVFPEGLIPAELARTIFLDSSSIRHLPGYAGDKPVFVGHYWLNGKPACISPSIACVDYSIAAGGNLTAYSYECSPGSPSKLYNSAFMQVDASGILQ
ncbi:metallophosphoesterase [Spirochaeta dissipatitropha]